MIWNSKFSREDSRRKHT